MGRLGGAGRPVEFLEGYFDFAQARGRHSPGRGQDGPFFLSVVDFGMGRSKKPKGPKVSAPYFKWAFAQKRPGLTDGGQRLRYEEDGLYRFEPPRTFPACKAATLGDATDGR